MFKDEIEEPPPSKEDAEELKDVYHLIDKSKYGSFEEHFDLSADLEVEEPRSDYNSKEYETRIFEEND